jgi:hypothetical protein
MISIYLMDNGGPVWTVPELARIPRLAMVPVEVATFYQRCIISVRKSSWETLLFRE